MTFLELVLVLLAGCGASIYGALYLRERYRRRRAEESATAWRLPATSQASLRARQARHAITYDAERWRRR